MDDLLEGLLAGAADGCMVVVGAFLALILLGALVSLLFEPVFWLLAATAGIVAAALWWGRRGRSEPTVDPQVKGENGHADVRAAWCQRRSAPRLPSGEASSGAARERVRRTPHRETRFWRFVRVRPARGSSAISGGLPRL
jgi:hypothetical protein